MSKKATFGEEDDTPMEGDGSSAQGDATVREETKTASRRKSTRKATTQPPTPAKKVATVDAMAATVESEVAQRLSPHSDASGIGGISDSESGEDEDLTLHSHKGEEDKDTTGADGDRSSAGRRDREGSVASSVDTIRSMTLGEGRSLKKKDARDFKGNSFTILPTATTNNSNSRHGAT